MSLKFTDENFEQEVLKADTLALIDFYADWCGPCKMMAPVIDEIANEFEGIVKVGKLNVDNSPSISSKYKVMTIPTLLFIKNGEVIDTIIGVVPKATLVEKINSYK